jgi:hypothetical protein
MIISLACFGMETKKKLIGYPLKIKWKNFTKSAPYTSYSSINQLYTMGWFDGIVIVISVEPAVLFTNVWLFILIIIIIYLSFQKSIIVAIELVIT